MTKNKYAVLTHYPVTIYYQIHDKQKQQINQQTNKKTLSKTIDTKRSGLPISAKWPLNSRLSGDIIG